MKTRIGQGLDVHQLVPGRPLVLGGVTLPFDRGLAGHSDADVLVHAVCDALLGAAALGDIGDHFPDTDPAYRNIDSLVLLAETGRLLAHGSHTCRPNVRRGSCRNLPLGADSARSSW